MSAFFAPAIGNSTVRVVLTSTPQSVLIGVGGNAVRCVSDGSGGVPGYFVTYRAIDGVPAASPLDVGVVLGMYQTGGNDIIIKKPRGHDSVYCVSTANQTVHFQPGEVDGNNFFAPAIGNSGVKVTAGLTAANVLIGAGGNAVRALNEGSGAILAYFMTYKASDGTPSVTSGTGVIISSYQRFANEIVIKKPREHDSISYISLNATTVVLHFQPGEV